MTTPLSKGYKVTPPAKKTTPAKATPKSLQEALAGNKDEEKYPVEPTPVEETPEKDVPENEDDNTDDEDEKSNFGVSTPPGAKMEDVRSSLDADDDRPSVEDEENQGLRTEAGDIMAPGDGILKEEYEDEDEESTHRKDVEITDVGVLSRIHKMSPTGMTHLNTYSGGEDRVIHDNLDVVVKPLGADEIVRERKIQDETGKSRLLHPDITEPAIPSEQATVAGGYFQHSYAVPYDPENDPNR